MKVGVIFPQTEIGDDPAVIKDFAQAVESLGYDHLVIFDHVLGADVSTRPDWRGPYTSDTPFHEVFVLLGYLAAITNLELVPGVLILPQRQTVLVAKQAADGEKAVSLQRRREHLAVARLEDVERQPPVREQRAVGQKHHAAALGKMDTGHVPRSESPRSARCKADSWGPTR